VLLLPRYKVSPREISIRHYKRDLQAETVKAQCHRRTMSTYNPISWSGPLPYYCMKSELSPTATMVERPASSGSDEPPLKIPDDDKSSRGAASSIVQDVSQKEATREFVTWDGPDDPENPKNWSYAYKWWITIIMCILCLDV
jgi:hypothetical protein